MAFRKVLIANRGEIACRIMRTANAMGYRTVAVFSDADTNALHVRQADEAVRIGPSAPTASYLNIDAILEAARKTGANAVHPGYGFLAENAVFAKACADAGLVFIGPPAGIIAIMGDKVAAKARAAEAGVPCVPGYDGSDQSPKRLEAEAVKLGFPLLIKAVAGGGGRGIRAVHSRDEFAGQVEAARREAEGAFGDGRVMLERLIEQPRHIEVQVFGDVQGNVIHLYERDCTVQRRRQKLIEETPCPVLTPELRTKLCDDAVRLARGIGYVNAGTVEFIADENLNLYFLEMNTRLQVEHPVTEMITGLDLVEWQFRVAAGEPLPLTQEQVRITGHAIEARLCAENPYNGFAPQTGELAYWRPASAPGVRIDSGVEEGGTVSPFYDSMVAKVIAHGRDRAEAIRKLASTLEDTPLLGLSTNQSFLAKILQSPDFANSIFATNTLDSWLEQGADTFQPPKPSPELWALAAALHGSSGGEPASNSLPFTLELVSGSERKVLRYEVLRDGTIRVTAHSDAREIRLLRKLFQNDPHGSRRRFAPPHHEGISHDFRPQSIAHDFRPKGIAHGPHPEERQRRVSKDAAISYEIDGVVRSAVAVKRGNVLHLSAGAEIFTFNEPQPKSGGETIADGRVIVAPVAGLIVQLLVEVGQAVAAGETLALIEAMKMEMRVTAPKAGTVVTSHVSKGAQVAAGTLLFEIETQETQPNG